MKKSVAAAIVFCAAATASLCWPAANALPNDCEALDYSGTYTFVVDQVVFYYWGKDGTEEGRLEGYANSTYNVHPVVISAAPPAAGDDAFLLSFNPNETDFLSTEFEAGLCYACNDDTYPVLSCASTGTDTYELRPTTVSADCKVMSMAGVQYQSGTPPCTVGGCAPFIETRSYDRIDDDYEGDIFEAVAIPPPAPAVEGCDQVSYAGEFELLVSEAQVSPTNASSFVKLPSVQELTIEAPSSADASKAGDGAFILYNEADGGLPTAVCLTRPVAFSGDLACVKIFGSGKVVYVPVAANEGCRVTKAVGILSEPKTVGGPEDPLNFKSTIIADGAATPAMEDGMETSSPAADGCAAYNFTGTFANDMTSMTPNAVGDGVNVGIVSNTTTIREGVGGAGTYIVVTDGIPGPHGVLMCSTSVRTGIVDESILECASTGSRGFASIYPGAVDEECNVVEANLLLLVSWVIDCEDQACAPFAAQGSLSRV